MAGDEDLRAYEERRDTTRSGEPSAQKPVGDLDRPIYVCQRHHASSLHFDLRLEVDGALTSWAVPKGPSTNPTDKRLAVRVEDHPLAYATFEGAIPQADYGGGTVIVWDLGTFVNTTRRNGSPVDVADALEHGHLVVELHGEKMRGAVALTRTKMSGRGEQWLLVKKDDAFADRRRKPAKTQLESVLTGRTNADLERERDERRAESSA